MQDSRETHGPTAPIKETILNADLISDNGMRLLDAIDDLRRLGIDKDIPLPQIVVVGLQSAGKSSVLEAISGIAFPVGHDQCTTFASEIRLRRSREGKQSIAMNIVSKVPGRPGEEKLQPLKSSKAAEDDNPTQTTWAQMPKIIDQAAEAMGNVQGQKFCEDVLRIEVSGPTQDHLSLIDLPGIVHVMKPGQDPAAPQRVQDTIFRYMREERSIILVVVSAKLDYNSQEILRMVKQIDPSGSRTMGIITGVDLISEGMVDRERDYIRLAQNELHPLVLGWHVVRNLSFEDRKNPNADRNTLEDAFFSKKVEWQTIPERDRGAPQLKKKLSLTLLAHMGKELGGVITALESKIIDRENVLTQLGPERSSSSDRLLYLTQLGTRHQSLSKCALDGVYDDRFFALTGLRLRAKLVQAFDSMNEAILKAHRWDFWTVHNDAHSYKKYPEIGEKQSVELSELPYKVCMDEYLAKVDDVLQQCRGRELQGLFDPHLVGILFKDQACRWEIIARSTILNIIKLLKLFLETVTHFLVERRRAQLLLHRKLLPALQERERAVNAKLDEILKPFHQTPPRTHNPQFRELLQSRNAQLSAIKAASKPPLANLRDRMACEKLAVSMQCYYEVARATFVDNVISLGIELCLLDGFADILSPISVASMTKQDVFELASEFPEDTIERQKAQHTLKTLRTGLDICREHDRSELQAASFSPGLGLSTESSFTVTLAPFTSKTTPIRNPSPTPPPSTSQRSRSHRSASSNSFVKSPFSEFISSKSATSTANSTFNTPLFSFGQPNSSATDQKTSADSSALSGASSKPTTHSTFNTPSFTFMKTDSPNVDQKIPTSTSKLFGTSPAISISPTGSKPGVDITNPFAASAPHARQRSMSPFGSRSDGPLPTGSSDRIFSSM